MSMVSLLQFVEAIRPLSDKLKSHLQSSIKERRIFRNELVLKAGHVCRNIYFIQKGLLRAYYIKKDEEISSWFMKEGDFVISVSSFFSQIPSKESIQALEDGIIFYLPYEVLQDTYARFPEFNSIGRVITEKYYTLSEDRISSMRMLRAHERYEFLVDNHPELIKRVSSKFLASYLGVTEVTLSRAKFKK